MKKNTTITDIEPSDFTKEFRKRLNAKYEVIERVDKLFHDLHVPDRNRKAAEHLKMQSHTTLVSLPRGELQLFDSAVVFMTAHKDYPVSFFYTFKHFMFDHKQAVQEVDLECLNMVKDIRIESLPLSAYALFKVLLPRYKIVIGGAQHTPSGERWSKKQIREAIEEGFHVYLRNDNGDLYDADSYEVVEMNEDYLWGVEQHHRLRLTVISTEKL